MSMFTAKPFKHVLPKRQWDKDRGQSYDMGFSMEEIAIDLMGPFPESAATDMS